MATTYTKSLSADFGGNLKIGQFHEEIDADVGIAPTLQKVTLSNDDVDITFDSALSAGEQTTLNNLVSAHVPGPGLGSKMLTITTNSLDYKGTIYGTATSFIYPGSQINTLTNIKIISNMDSGGTDYTIRIYDSTNRLSICSKTGTNLLEEIIDMGTLSNIPTTDVIFGIQTKVSGTTSLNIRSVTLYYN